MKTDSIAQRMLILVKDPVLQLLSLSQVWHFPSSQSVLLKSATHPRITILNKKKIYDDINERYQEVLSY